MKAPIGKRIIAYLIDSIIATLIGSVIIAVGAIMMAFVKNAIVNLLGILVILVGILLAMGYCLLRDGLSGGRSIGKKLMKLRVVKNDGSPSNYVSSILRNITFVIPLIGFIEIILPIVDKDGLRLGDKIAKTQVVE